MIVVDNSKDRSAAQFAGDQADIRYVHEPTPGLSQARNAGIRAATRPLIAFTDDDVTPHAGWTAEIVRAFDENEVELVTGLVLPSRLDTPAQTLFQLGLGGFGTSFIPILFDNSFFEETRAEAAPVWRIGAGANMAMRLRVFERVGLFDPRLGAGTSGCSEDSELWYRILVSGGELSL